MKSNGTHRHNHTKTMRIKGHKMLSEDLEPGKAKLKDQQEVVEKTSQALIINTSTYHQCLLILNYII